MSNNFLWNPDVKENGKETGQKEWRNGCTERNRDETGRLTFI